MATPNLHDITPGNPTVSVSNLENNQMEEDWEDWLRWDPTADAVTPEDSHFGSSKNDSPLQNAVYSVIEPALDKSESMQAQAPPLILGHGALDFGAADDTFFFGNPTVESTDFNFDQTATPLYSPTHILKLDTNIAGWTLPSNAAPDQDISLSAVSNEPSHHFSTASSISATTPSLHDSPESSSQARLSLSSTSPEAPKKRGGRKRKAETQESPKEGNEENEDSPDGDEPPIKKTSHNVIEKRYRNNLNDKIVELRNSVPSLRAMGRQNSGKVTEDLEGLTPAHKLNKATVMAKATEYIRHLEKRAKTMQTEMDALKKRLATIEAAVGQKSESSPNALSGQQQPSSRSRQPSASSQSGAPAFLNVPQDQNRFGQPIMQQQYSQPMARPTYARPPNPPVGVQNQPQHNRGRGGGVINKVMLGSMAGIMVMEGFSEQQSGDGSSAHGLSALPFPFIKSGIDLSVVHPSGLLANNGALMMLKLALVIGALVYILTPLFSLSPRPKQKSRSTVQLPTAPSLASPVEERRKAWLTAIQTVWVPKHFLLEVIAVLTKMIQLSVRRLVGAETFANITGTNKEEEAARIKAWDIAIEAQLAGGDAEVSYYRLLLTLMESGTLPDSPARLMQKAVHFRVFFWEVANAGYGNMIGFKHFTENVGKFYWDSARKLQKELVQSRPMRQTQHEDDVELLPDHLARLVELDCDEVLSDEMIQRAWNLAWNKPSAHCLVPNAARDSVIEDHAIRTPLDAVAAWYTNTIVDDTLADAACGSTSSFDTQYYIGLALSVAPPASNTHVRTLTAKAVLYNTNREANIVAALEALPVASQTRGINLVNHAPASPDVCTALTIAKLISLCSPSSSLNARMRAFATLNYLRLEPAQLSLLTAVASFRLLRVLMLDKTLRGTGQRGIEDLSGSLRVWIGTSAGGESGLSREGRNQIVQQCLDTAKRIGGWNERDSGYVSGEQSPERSKAHSATL